MKWITNRQLQSNPASVTKHSDLHVTKLGPQRNSLTTRSRLTALKIARSPIIQMYNRGLLSQIQSIISY